jgi:hypothetical protein
VTSALVTALLAMPEAASDCATARLMTAEAASVDVAWLLIVPFATFVVIGLAEIEPEAASVDAVLTKIVPDAVNGDSAFAATVALDALFVVSCTLICPLADVLEMTLTLITALPASVVVFFATMVPVELSAVLICPGVDTMLAAARCVVTFAFATPLALIALGTMLLTLPDAARVDTGDTFTTPDAASVVVACDMIEPCAVNPYEPCATIVAAMLKATVFCALIEPTAVLADGPCEMIVAKVGRLTT